MPFWQSYLYLADLVLAYLVPAYLVPAYLYLAYLDLGGRVEPSKRNSDDFRLEQVVFNPTQSIFQAVAQV